MKTRKRTRSTRPRGLKRTRTRRPLQAAERDERGFKTRATGLLRLARRAGTLVVGIQLTRDAVRRGSVRAIVMADDLGAGRAERLYRRWTGDGVRVYRGWSKDELGEIAGKLAVAVLAVTDRNIAAGIADLGAAAQNDKVME